MLALENFPSVEALILDLRFDYHLNDDEAIQFISNEYSALGPYGLAKRYNLLVSNSAEDFAVEWMSFFNKYTDSVQH